MRLVYFFGFVVLLAFAALSFIVIKKSFIPVLIFLGVVIVTMMMLRRYIKKKISNLFSIKRVG